MSSEHALSDDKANGAEPTLIQGSGEQRGLAVAEPLSSPNQPNRE